MESDISLIEISGEGDSLLQQTPSDDVSNNYFSCSPLHIIRSKSSADSSRISRLEGMKGTEHAEKPSFSSPRDHINKENTNANKSEVPKFSEDPQQMKKRKKGGGYNLRKSLAWNKAFFTEEGVLDPLELSMITGTFNKSSGDGLSVIHEEGRESLSGDSDCNNDSTDLQTLGEILFKELPASSLKKGKKIGSGFLLKHDSSVQDNVAPASVASHKVLSAHDINRSGSKRSGCPHPLASSSKKRPANAKTTKAAIKEPKLPKIPVSKLDPSLHPTPTKSAILGVSRSNRNQITQQEGMKGNEHAEKPSFSSPRDHSNKENTKANKSEVLKFSEDPQQMKRRKKGGGYNLRKSLAWNKAFFTEEGVLDPLELSMIAGTFNKSSGDGLSVIHEEGRESLSGDSDCNNDSADLQTLGENLFKELPASSLKKGKKIGSGLLLKHDSSVQDNVAPASVASRKVLSAHDINRSGSKHSGCPRPLASSSKKRPANAKTTKAAIKEPKLPKIPVSKPDPSSRPTPTKSAILGASRSNQNQITQQVNGQKSFGLKGSSKNTRSAQKNAKAGPDCNSLSSKTTAQPSRRNMVKSPLEINSSRNLQPPPVTEPNNGFEVIPDPVLPATRTQASSSHGESSKTAISLPQNVQYIGGNMQYARVQSAKSSGLRMPSPSLGFFGQPKASVSQNPLQKSTQPCNIREVSFPSLQKLGATNPVCELRPPRAPRKMLNVVNDITKTGNTRGLSSRRDCSVPSAVNSVPHENMELNQEVSNLQKVEAKVPNEPMGSEPINNQQQLHSILDDDDRQSQELAERYKVENISRELQMNDNKFLLQSGSLEQLKKDNDHEMVADVCTRSRDSSGDELENPHISPDFSPVVQVKGVSLTNFMIKQQQVEDKQCNLLVEDHDDISEPQSANVISYSKQGTHNDWLRSTHDINEQPGEQAELVKPCSHEVDRVSHVENQRLQTNDGILFQESRSSEAYQKFDNADVKLKVRALSGSELESSHGLSQFKHIEQANEGAVGVDIMTLKSHVADAQMQSSDCNLLVESCNSNPSITAVKNQCLAVDGINDHSGVQPELQNPCLIEKASQDRHGLRLKGSFGSKLENPHCLTQLNPTVQVEGVSGTNDLNEQHIEDNQYNLLAKNHGVITDLHSGDGTSYNCVTLTGHNNWVGGMHEVNEQSGEQSELSKACICDADRIPHDESQRLQENDGILTEESRSFEEFHKYDTENIADFSPKVRGSSGSKLESSCGSFQLKYFDQANEGAAGLYSMTKKSQMGNAQVQSLDGNLLVEGCSRDLTASAVSYGNELESSRGSSQLKYIDQTNEAAAGAYNMTEKSHVGDMLVQSLDGNQLVDGCNGNLITLAVRSKCLVVVDDINKQSGDLLELQNPCYSSEDSQGENVLESRSFEESQKDDIGNIVDVGLNFRGSSGNELESSYGPSQPKYTQQTIEGASGAGSMIEKSHAGDAQVQSLVCSVITESCNCNLNSSEVHNQFIVVVDDVNEQSGECLEKSSKTFHSLSEELGLSGQSARPSSNQSILQVVGINRSKSNTLPEEAETKISRNSNNPEGEVQQELVNAMSSSEDKDATTPMKSGNDEKQDDLVIKPPPNAVPFSDEWLAAIEAAGEDILTLKTGAVQNSPPDKSIPEPGPWSPVKRKNNEVGPFDCTKFTNIQPSNSH